jgi:DMSO/TMAO reductase YedYZ molybdopterin-dependent catalytic subunit
LLLQLGTGVGGLLGGAPDFRWVLWLHGLGGYAIVALTVWKGRIIVDTLRRRPMVTPSRLAFLLLTGLALTILATGIAWSTLGRLALGGASLLVVHGFLAVGLTALLLWHVRARRYVFRRPPARDRRAVLRLAGVSLLGLLLWRLVEPARAALQAPGASRRFTGSYETGSFTGQFPPTVWLADSQAPLALDAWRLTVVGAVSQPLTVTAHQLQTLAVAQQTATLDCTGGWYTIQAWQGVSLASLLDLVGVSADARSVTVVAASGYSRRFPLAEASRLLLATAVAGQPLDHGHGHPLRLVAPGYRGYAWVKWVTRIEVNETSHLWQPPLPVQ